MLRDEQDTANSGDGTQIETRFLGLIYSVGKHVSK